MADHSSSWVKQSVNADLLEWLPRRHTEERPERESASRKFGYSQHRNHKQTTGGGLKEDERKELEAKFWEVREEKGLPAALLWEQKRVAAMVAAKE